MNKFLVVRLSSFGDILHTAVAIQMLRLFKPEARLEWLAQEPYDQLIRLFPFVDQVWTVPRKIRQWNQLRITLSLRQFDIALDFQGLMKSALWSFFSSAPNRLGFHRNDLRERWCARFYTMHPPFECEGCGSRYIQMANQWNIPSIAGDIPSSHVIYKNLGLLSALDCTPEWVVTHLRVSVDMKIRESAHDEVRNWIKKQGHAFHPFVVIHPYSAWISKDWEVQRWQSLIQRLVSHDGYGVVLTWGPDEREKVQKIAGKISGPVRIAPFSDWERTSALLMESKGVIGLDTSVAHLGCALGKPTVFLMGPTDPERNGPWRKSIQSAIYHKQPCGPCYRKKCPFALECMQEIQVQEVMARFHMVMERAAWKDSDG